MKILIQRVLYASVEVDEEIVSSIQKGMLAFVGVTHTDTEVQVEWLANKLIHLRIFEDAEGKMNRSLIEQNGEILVISQFTLYADCSTGRRPSFTESAKPELANALYEKFVEELIKKGIKAKKGVFGADMKVSLINDGPVTLLLERSSS